jgi:high-affinity Fe2+/Pb2+ permease
MAKKNKDKPEGLFIPAGVIIGLGVGFLTGNIVAWLLIGLGIGFFLFALLSIAKRNN